MKRSGSRRAGAGVVGAWAVRGGCPACRGPEVGVQPRGDQRSRSGEPESPLAAGSLGSSLECVCVCVCVCARAPAGGENSPTPSLTW